MIVKKLRPWVTSFSEAITATAKHGEEVCVGGEITHILNFSDILPDADKEEVMVYLSLDDGVGVNNVAIPLSAYEVYQKEHDLKIGDIVLAEGRVFHLNIEHKGKKVKNHPEQTIRVLTWKLSPLPEEEPAEV